MRISSTRRRNARAAAATAWPTEAALCDAFADQARLEGYRVHAETSGWDLLLVAPDDSQIGVQAKLHLSVEVLAQALGTPPGGSVGPDHHSVLVPLPELRPAFGVIARALRLIVFDASSMLLARKCGRDPIAAAVEHARIWEHTEREWVPGFEVPGIGGGRSGPIQITKWKIAAMKLCRVLRERGHLTRNDFLEHSVSSAWWLRGPDAVLAVERVGKRFRYVISGAGSLPDERWPEVAAALDRSLRELSQ